MKRTTILAAFAALGVLSATAQMDNVVEVENTYTPVVKDANKINVLPEVEKTTTTHYQVQYAEQATPTTNYVFQPSDVVQSSAEQAGAPRGFASVGGGIRGNLNMRGAYGWRITSADQLDFDFSIRGHKGRVDHALYDGLWSSRFYTTRGAVGYEHHFKEQGTLQVNAYVESQVFNYMPERDANGNMIVPDKQHNSLIGVEARLTPLTFNEFHIGGAVGYNTFYQKYIHAAPFNNEKPSELQLWVKANALYDISNELHVGLDLHGNTASYSFDTFDTYNSLTFTPHFDITNKQVDLRVGMHLHANYGFQTKLRLAPDVRLRYHASSNIDLFAGATGGEVRNEFRHFAQMSPYWSYNNQQQMEHQFDIVRVNAGMDWCLGQGLYARLMAGYDVSKDRAELYEATRLTTANGSLFYVNVGLDYQPSDVWGFDVKTQMNGWATKADENIVGDVLAWRPILDIRANAHYEVLRGLQLGADYMLQTFSHDDTHLYNRPVTNNLGASATYTLPLPDITTGSKLSFYLRGDNLFNRHYDAYMGYRAQSITFLAGVALTF